MLNNIQIGNYTIGVKEKPFMVAEMSGNHNQLVVIFPMLTFPTPWLFNDHWTKSTRITAITKINSPRARLLCKNCPSPGTITEKNILGVELVKDLNVFSEVVMKELFLRL